jgi:23S rRNA (adenine-C8)-methyltransferase
MTTLSKDLRDELEREFGYIKTLPINRDQETKDVQKVLFELDDKERIEAVLMKYKGYESDHSWNSLCISSQVGCNLGCKFCATGLMGFKRNLTVDEIIAQPLYYHLQGIDVKNILFMGMGEPLLNPNIYEALDIFNNKSLFNKSYRKITVSTVGIVPGLKKLVEDYPQINITYSLHSPFNEERSKLMPVNEQYPIEQVFETLNGHLYENNRKTFIAYLMLKGFNDSKKHARELAKLIKKQGKKSYLYHVNLIRFHDIENERIPFESSSDNVIRQFANYLKDEGISVTIRQSFGEEIEAACGQLYGEYGLKT